MVGFGGFGGHLLVFFRPAIDLLGYVAEEAGKADDN